MSTPLRQRLVRIHNRVLKRFIHKADIGENWRMPPPDYDGSQLISGDCEDFCLAARQLLQREGIPNRLVYCEVNGGGHLVVEVEGWILDNTQRTVVPNTALSHYRWLRISGYASGEPWREVV